MNQFNYHTEDESLIPLLDDEFDVVCVIGEPEDGMSDGFNLSIHDTRTEVEISEQIRRVECRKSTRR